MSWSEIDTSLDHFHLAITNFHLLTSQRMRMKINQKVSKNSSKRKNKKKNLLKMIKNQPKMIKSRMMKTKQSRKKRRKRRKSPRQTKGARSPNSSLIPNKIPGQKDGSVFSLPSPQDGICSTIKSQ